MEILLEKFQSWNNISKKNYSGLTIAINKQNFNKANLKSILYLKNKRLKDINFFNHLL